MIAYRRTLVTGDTVTHDDDITVAYFNLLAAAEEERQEGNSAGEADFSVIHATEFVVILHSPFYGPISSVPTYLIIVKEQ